jgi:putative ABC transport system ATP-binding protein
MSLTLDRIHKSFAQGASARLKILEDCSLDLKSGEIAAVLGESGSGKSTLLSLIAGFDRPDQGDLLWNGESTKTWTDDRWAEFRRKGLGFVFQDYYLIPYLTAEENVTLPLKILNSKSEAGTFEAASLLQQMGLGERRSHLPAQMSGGECQRVGIARALIHRPGLILADEPTGSLDAKTGEQVSQLMFGLLRELKQTALIVTHSAEVAKRCDRVLTLKQGRLWPS